MAYPRASDFPANVPASKWRDLPVGVYQVTKVTSVNTKYGKAYVAQLALENEAKYECFVPSSVERKLNEMTIPCFLNNKGITQHPADPSKTYFAVECMPR